MATKKVTCPVEIVLVMIDRKFEKDVEEIFRTFGVNKFLTCLAEGTAKSAMGDLFGLGATEKSVVSGFVETSKSRELLENLRDEIGFDKSGRGLAITMPISSATNKMLEMFGIKV